MKRVRLNENDAKHARPKKKPLRYTSVQQRQQLKERRKRQRLGIRHDEPIPADKPFILAIKGIARAKHDLKVWRGNLERFLFYVTHSNHGGNHGLRR